MTFTKYSASVYTINICVHYSSSSFNFDERSDNHLFWDNFQFYETKTQIIWRKALYRSENVMEKDQEFIVFSPIYLYLNSSESKV